MKEESNLKKYLEEGLNLGHFEPETLNVDINDIRKGIMPEFPKNPPPEMIDGYSAKSRLAPKKLEKSSFIKITKKDLAKNHKLKNSEIKEFMDQINAVNDFIKKHPEELIYAQTRYPKSDTRLAQLNWQMDRMLDAGKKYFDSNFKENQTLYKRAMDRIKKNTSVTNPDYIQKHYDELRGTIKPKSKPLINRKSPSRLIKKPKKKWSMEAINNKIKQLDKDLLI